MRGRRIVFGAVLRVCLVLVLIETGLVAATSRASAAQDPDSPPGSSSANSDTINVDTLQTVRVLGSIIERGSAVGADGPAHATIIGGAHIGRWRPRLLSNLLDGVAGASLYDDLGSAFKTTISYRGFTASPVVGLPQGLSVFLDGVPVNEPDAGQVNFDLLPLDQVERVEFLGGTASLLGPHSLGGAVNLITHDGASAPGGALEVGAGAFGARSGMGTVGGEHSGGLRYLVSGAYKTEDGWRQLTGATRRNILLNVGNDWAAAGVQVQLLVADAYAETAGSLPLSVYRVRPDSNLSSGDFEDIGQVHASASAYRALGGGRASTVLYFRRHDAERYNVNQVNDPDVRSFSANRSVGVSADWRRDVLAGAGTLSLRFGAGGSSHRSRVRIFAERIDPGLTTDIESPIARLDAYAMAGYRVDRVTLTGGLRYDVVRIPFRNRLDSTRDTTSTFRRVSPRAGVEVGLGTSGALFASVGQGFRPPALIELACADPEEPCPLPFALGDDPPLDPVVATTYETGAHWTAGGILMRATAFRTEVRDDIFLFPYDDASEPEGSTIDGFFQNIARTRREGLEFDTRASVGRFALHASHAIARATFQVDSVELFSIRTEGGGSNIARRGDEFPLVPRHMSTIGAATMIADDISLGVEARRTGRRFLRGDEANEEAPLPAFWIVDARTSAGVGRWEVQAVVRNLLDATYASFGTFNINQGAGDVVERFLTPGEGRRVDVVLRLRFGSGQR